MIGETGLSDRYVYTAAAWGSDTIHSFDFNGETLDFSAAEIDLLDFATYEWDPLGLGYNSTTLFEHQRRHDQRDHADRRADGDLSDADFLFA